MLWKTVLLSILTGSLVACSGAGAIPGVPATPTGDQSSGLNGATPLSPAFTLTNDDDGKTLQVQVGQVVDVALRAGDSLENWEVGDPDPTVLAPTVHPAATAARGVTLRAFKAVGPGTTTISATDRPQCNSGEFCAQFILGFKAAVVVAP